MKITCTFWVKWSESKKGWFFAGGFLVAEAAKATPEICKDMDRALPKIAKWPISNKG